MNQKLTLIQIKILIDHWTGKDDELISTIKALVLDDLEEENNLLVLLKDIVDWYENDDEDYMSNYLWKRIQTMLCRY